MTAVTKPVKPVKLNKKQRSRLQAVATSEQVTISQAIDQALQLLEEQAQTEHPRGLFTREEIDNHPLTKALKKAKSVPVEKADIEAIEIAKREVKNGEYYDGEEVFKSLGI